MFNRDDYDKNGEFIGEDYDEDGEFVMSHEDMANSLSREEIAEYLFALVDLDEDTKSSRREIATCRKALALLDWTTVEV